MKFVDKSCDEFVKELASKAPVPGGGGAAAMVGSIGTALGSMVCNLTLGKKKYAQYEEEIQSLLTRITEIIQDLLNMIDEDADNFLPLSRAYGMPADTEQEKKLKQETMEKALKQACQVPIAIVKASYEGIQLHAQLVDKCSLLAISDVGVGVQCLRTAILSGMLNVIININSIQDKEYVESVKQELTPMVQEGVKLVDEVYNKVEALLKK